MRLGIDSGGTFTDFVLLEEGKGRVYKVPSTPAAPLKSIIEGVAVLCPQGLEGVEVVHGTTRGTNAFLERQGARVALLTTAGESEPGQREEVVKIMEEANADVARGD